MNGRPNAASSSIDGTQCRGDVRGGDAARMSISFDRRYVSRLLIKSPGYVFLSTVVVALSVGLALWSFALAYLQAFKPLPFPNAERWYSVQIAADSTSIPAPAIDAYTYEKLLERTPDISHVGAFSVRPAVLSDGRTSTSLHAVAISPGLLSATGAVPEAGRLFDDEESNPGARRVAALSFAAWQRYFAGDPGIVGGEVRIDGHLTRIVGVLRQDFYAFQDFELWLPLQLEPLAQPSNTAPTLTALISLQDEQRLPAIENALNTAIDAVNRNFPDIFGIERHAALIPAGRMFTHQTLMVVSIIGGMAFAITLLACVNLSMMFLARFLERSRELALRIALGSSRWRLVRQALLETVFVVAAGLVLGTALAALGMHWGNNIAEFGARMLATGSAPQAFGLTFANVAAGILAALVVWLLSTLPPAWRVAGQDPSAALTGTTKGTASIGSSRAASVLVGIQVTISSLVMVVCIALAVAAREAADRPTGIDSSHVVLSTYPTVFGDRYSETPERLRYWGELRAAIQSRLPGTRVAYASAVPTRPNKAAALIDGEPRTNDAGMRVLPFAAVSEDYFELLGIRLESGRLFDVTDDSSSRPVAVVDQRTAERYWPGEDPVGKRIQLDPGANEAWLTIVGIVSAVAQDPYSREPGVVYTPLRQSLPSAFHLLVRLPATTADNREALRGAANDVQPDLPLRNLQPLEPYLAALDLHLSVLVPVMFVIAGMTLILAATGLFGLISRSVTQRTQEAGIRRALGGTQWQVTAVFLRRSLPYLCVAVLGGGAGTAILYAISALVPDVLAVAAPVTLGVIGVIALVIFISSYLPTRRAVALEPGDALRHE